MRIWIKIHIALLLTLAPLLLGGVHIATQAILGVGAALLAALWSVQMRSRKPSKHTVCLDGWFWLLLFAILVTALQLIPLPLSWIAKLSPQTDQVLRQTLGGVGLYKSSHWQPLSLAPPETAAKLIRDIGAWLLYFFVLQWAHQRSRLQWLMKASVCIAGSLAALTLAQTVLGVREPLMGLYLSRGTLGNPISASPFINPNHMGAYNLFHALLALPLLVEAKENRRRAIWSICLLLLSSLTFLSLSRGAIACYALGVVTFSLLYWRHRVIPSQKKLSNSTPKGSSNSPQKDRQPTPPKSESQARKSRTLTFLISICVAGVGLAFLISLTNVSIQKEFHDTEVGWNKDKVGFVTGHAKPLLKHYPWVGVGRGAMALAWPRFATVHTLSQGKQTITHIESSIVQPLIDWGIPMGLLFVLTVLWLLWRLFRRSLGLLEQSVMLAIFALLLQNVSDFNMEYIGTAFPILAFLAALNRLQAERRKARTYRSLWFPAALGLAAIALIGWLAPYAYKHHIYRLPQRWSEVVKKPRKQFGPALQRFVRHHPSDPMVANLLARRYTFQSPWKPLQALQWLKRGSFLAPTASDTMILRAYNLARLGLGEQAIQELDKAVHNNPALAKAAFTVLKQFKLELQALKLSQESTLLQRIHRMRYIRKPRPKDYEQRLEESIQRFPKIFYFHQLLVSYRMAQWQRLSAKAAQWKKRKRAPETIAQALSVASKRLQQSLQQIPKNHFAGRSTARMFQGTIALTQKRYTQAESHFRWVNQNAKRPHWWSFQQLFLVLLRQKKFGAARNLLIPAQRHFHTTYQKAHLVFLDGQLLQKQGRFRYALQRYEYATQLNPKKHYQLTQAHLCWELGQYFCTLRIYRGLLRDPRNKHLKAKLLWYEKKSQQRSK